MNLDNIKLIKNQNNSISWINIYLKDNLLPIIIIKGINYFEYEKDKFIEELELNPNHWLVCCFSNELQSHYIQTSLVYSDADILLYKLVNNFSSQRKQFSNLELALKFALNIYFKYLNLQLKYLNINCKIKEIKNIEEIQDLLLINNIKEE